VPSLDKGICKREWAASDHLHLCGYERLCGGIHKSPLEFFEAPPFLVLYLVVAEAHFLLLLLDAFHQSSLIGQFIKRHLKTMVTLNFPL
jgi:hypothetical protein